MVFRLNSENAVKSGFYDAVVVKIKMQPSVIRGNVMEQPNRVLLVLIVLVSVLLLSPCAASAAKEPPSKYDPFLNSVVVVRSSIGEGAGFFVTPDGLLITNHHVVGDDNAVSIIMRNGTQTVGTVLSVKEKLDLALVAVKEKSPAFLDFAKPNEGGVGSDVIAIGTAKGLSWSVSRGIVSGLRDGAEFNIGGGEDVVLIQTDAAINPGNSGGPLILLDSGTVVGVNTISFKKHIAEGISFAVSAENTKKTFAKYLGNQANAQSEGDQPALDPKQALALWMSDPQKAIARMTQTKTAPVEEAPGAVKNVVLANPQKFTVKNDKEGPLLIIMGRAKNNHNESQSYIRLVGTLHDQQGAVLQTKKVYCGNFLSDQELETLSMKEIENRLNKREGFKGANRNIPPGQSITFMVVYDHIPPQASNWAVNVYSSK